MEREKRRASYPALSKTWKTGLTLFRMGRMEKSLGPALTKLVFPFGGGCEMAGRSVGWLMYKTELSPVWWREIVGIINRLTDSKKRKTVKEFERGTREFQLSILASSGGKTIRSSNSLGL